MTAEAAAAPPPKEGNGQQGEAQLEGGNYEVIRARLLEQGRELQKRAEALNGRRKETFGGTELQVASTERIRTENNCMPRDIVEVAGHLLLGYNVFLGLKSETKLADVFSLHKFEPRAEGGYDCSAVGLEAGGGFLVAEQFAKDFTSLYKYARDAQLLQLVATETRLFAVFQVGSSFKENKVFRWRIEASGAIAYMDDRGEREYPRPAQHDFEWMPTTADDHVEGRFVGVADKVFVSCTEGRLRISVEDNTKTGRTVLLEPVSDSNQHLSDAAIQYAEVGHLVLLKILPFREDQPRYYVFNTKSQTAARIDAIGLACLELPEDHGLLFPGGYYLDSGDYKIFEGETADLEFHRKMASPNGEDVLFIFYGQRDGRYVLFPYNLIRKEVQTPIHCHGWSLFDDGVLVVFRAVDEPTRIHPMQVWQTPFTSAEVAAAAPTDGSFLAKVGNADLVRGISDALSLHRLVKSETPTRQSYEDVIARCGRMIDGYYWLGHAECGDLRSVATQIRDTADLIIDEFEKVVAFQQEAQKALADAEEKFIALTRDMRPEHWKRVDPYLEALAKLRGLRGSLITLKEMRYMDLQKLGEIEKRTVERFDEVSKACVGFLLREEALKPLIADLEAIVGKIGDVKKASDVKPLKEKLDLSAEGLALLSEVVANLQIDDATQRTRILEGLSVVFGHLNRSRAVVEGRRKELMSSEGRAEFAAQFAVLGQAVSSALGLCDTPEKCDEQLSRMLVQLEELEGRFSEFDEFLAQLGEKREEIYDAFGAKKQQLLDERSRRVQNLAQAAERILDGVSRRARAMGGVDELNAYFASDAMVLKVRQLCEQLVDLGDSVKADAYEARLKTARQEALRGLRDKLELFEGGDNLIKLGRHRFSVNTQALELTMVPRDGGMALHLTGTDFYEMIDDAAFAATRRFWDQNLPSENADVYRGEYLAFSLLTDAEQGRGGLSLAALHAALRDGKLGDLVRAAAQERYEDGYERGVHDQDATLLLEKLIGLYDAAGLLRFAPAARGLGQLFWASYGDGDAKRRWSLQAQNLGRLRKALGRGEALTVLANELVHAIQPFAEELGLGVSAREAATYLVEELTGESWFTSSADADQVREALQRQLDLQGTRAPFDDDLRALDGKPRERYALARAWVEAFLDADPTRAARKHLGPEVAAMIASPGLARRPSAALVEADVTGLLGQHARIQNRAMKLRIDELLARLGRYLHDEAPAYRAYRKLRHEILERERASLRLAEYTPRVMTAFVRNKLINDVYLPVVGDNLAKQIGAAGAGKRTDLMGLLLLVSPPGYGKTTLMEYVASRLGLVFMKVNGPALGHGVTSIDPAEAPNATARQEVEKINLAFEMGNNVMLYLDDIQHCNPELLQKFISLCDAQRRVEGVWRGKTRTYDFRGRKFCVVMAGNPYTESGDVFEIPDMLANRADTYNLGDILQGKDDAFALSYLENALTSNPVLQPLAMREQGDVYRLISMARGEPVPTTDLKHGYSAVEIDEIKAVFAHLFRLQQTLLKVNLQYIASAAQDDKFRTEPPFKLQGSYRNMNKLAEKVASAMTHDEVERLVGDHYVSEAQTLTTGAEANLLKLAELRGRMGDTERARWDEIKREFTRHKRMGGNADDPVARVTGTLGGIGADLQAIRDVLREGSSRGIETGLGKLGVDLGAIKEALGASGGGGTDKELSRLVRQLSEIKGALQKGTGAGMTERLDLLATKLEGIKDALQAAADAKSSAEVMREAMRSEIPPAPAPGDGPPHDAYVDAVVAATRHGDGAEDDAPRVHRARRLAGAEQWLTPYLLRIEAALEAIVGAVQQRR
jgi:DNA repair ATPase/dynein-related subfamily AAA family protein